MQLRILKQIKHNVYLTDHGELLIDQDKIDLKEVYELDTHEEFIWGDNLNPSDQADGFTIKDGLTYITGHIDEIFEEMTATVKIDKMIWLIAYQGEIKKERVTLRVSKLTLYPCNY